MHSGNISAASVSGGNMVPFVLWIGLRRVFRLSVGGIGRSAECVSGAVSQSKFEKWTWIFDHDFCSRKNCGQSDLFLLGCIGNLKGG